MPFPLDSARLPTPSRRRSAPPSLRGHRTAATVLFAVDGLVFGSWASRIPDVATQVGAGPTTLGLALLCVSLGALASMQLTGALCARLGPGLVSAAAAALTGGALALPGLCGSVAELCVALLVLGATTGTLNVAANAVGVRVEAAARRPVLPSLHAGFSFGGLAGAVLGGLAAAAAPPAVHLLLVGACAVLVTVAVGPTLLAADGDRVSPGGGATRAGAARGLVVLLGVIAGCTAFGEGAVTDWGALHLQEMGASPLLAAAGYAGFSLAMASGRLAGNGLVRALGPTRVMAGGALLAAAGAAVAAGVPVVGAGIAGFVLIGLGLANVFPIAIARAGAHAGAAGVALASTVGYTGLLGGPPLLGIVAEAVGLHVAFGAVALLAAVAAGLTLLARTPQARPARWRTAAAALGQQLRTTAEPALRQARAGLVASAGRARTAAHGHAQGLDLLHDQLTGSRSRPRPYPGLEALAA